MAMITLRHISAAEGKKTFGAVKIGEWQDRSPITIPVQIVNGRKPGPVVLVMAGIHGDEVNGAEAIRRLVVEVLDPATLRGAVVGLPVVNTPSYIVNARANTLEENIGSNDASRIMATAQPTGSLSERIACFVRDEAVALAEYVIDLHASMKGSENYPRAIVAGERAQISPELRAKIDRLERSCGFEYIFKPRAASWKGMYFQPSSLYEEKLGKAKITLETGHAPDLAGAEILVRGMQNILVELEMIDGTIERMGPSQLMESLVAVRANGGGIWHPKYGVPHAATEGELIGHVLGLGDEVVEEVRAPVSGIAIKVATQGAVATGQRLFVFGVPYPS